MSRPSRFVLLALLAAVIGGLHGLVYVPFAQHVEGDTPSYTEPAHALLDGSFSTPLPNIDVTGLKIPRAARGAPERETYRTPGYPLLLAAAGGGTSRRSVDAVIAVQSVLSGIAVFVLALAFNRLWGERTALLGASLAALDPYTKHYVSRVLSEVLAGVLVAAAAYAFVRAWQSGRLVWWVGCGALTGALALTRPFFLLALPVALVGVLLRQVSRRERVVAAAATTLASAALVGPWLAWTNAATGRPVLQSFGEGWNLLIAAHGEGLHRTAVDVESSPAYRRDFDSVHRLAPSAAALRQDPTAHPHYLAAADARQRDLALDLYGRRLEHEPLTVIGETLYRAYFLWMVHEDWRQPGYLLPVMRLLDWLTLALLSVGAWLALRRDGPARVLAIFLFAFTAVNAAHHVEARYAIPVRELALGYVAFALSTVARRAGAQATAASSK